MAKKNPAEAAPWTVHFFERHRGDVPGNVPRVPGKAFLDTCPTKVRAKIIEVLRAVAAAPPPSFSGGGYWKAMHDDMNGWYEICVDTSETHYRLFCILERQGWRDDLGLGHASVVIIDGRTKPMRTVLSDAEYAKLHKLGDEYRARKPRSIEQRK